MIKKPKSAETYPGPGFRILKTINRPPVEIIEQYRSFPTPDVSDMLNRLYTMKTEIKNLSGSPPLVGPACTVKTFPGDNLMVHKSLDIAQPGDVLVIDSGGMNTHAVMGDLIANKLHHRGIAGVIIDGLVRDISGIKEVGLCLFARGVTPIGPLHRGPGEINYSISCGGIVVNPGDIVSGDENGVVVIRKDFANELLQRLYDQRDSLNQYVENVKRGIFSNDWVDQELTSSQCEINDE